MESFTSDISTILAELGLAEQEADESISVNLFNVFIVPSFQVSYDWA